MEKLLHIVKRLLPRKVFAMLQPSYHKTLALGGAVIYGFPSRHIKVVAVTGTKGKSSVVELANAILEEAGFKTALLSTVRFKVDKENKPNLLKMTTPGRFFVQKFLRRAVKANCDYAIVEMTSEAARQFRHKFINFDALIFTNLSPEHIESHGSYEKYVAAKLSIGKALEKSPEKILPIFIPPLLKVGVFGDTSAKVAHSDETEDLNPSSDKNRSAPFSKGRIGKILVVNADEKESAKFLALNIPSKLSYSLKNAEPYETGDGGISFTFAEEKISPKLEGVFNIYNCLAAATFAQSQGIKTKVIKLGLEKVTVIKGRVEHVDRGQNFTVIVDYAHTPDSLEKLYQVFSVPRLASDKTEKLARDEYTDQRKLICVLGNTGGGRDTWKRPVMAGIAEKYCDEIILTNEDPYDEDPMKILREMASGMKNKKPKIMLDRREAIAAALQSATARDTVLITGKGTDPCICGPNGTKLPWDDATVVREELGRLFHCDD